MTFRVLSLLWLLGIVPFALFFLVARERHRDRVARRFASERLRGVTNPARWLRPWLLGIALAASVVALAGPYAGYTTVPIFAREANRVILIDVSNSMAAEDVGTSRLSAAKAIAKRIVDAQVGRVALIVFEASPDVVAPLTSDGDAVVALLDTLDAGELGQPGSDIGGAIIAALRLVEDDPTLKADIVLISDGEEQGMRLSDALQRAKAKAIPVSTIVIGDSRGAQIPSDGGPMSDDAGKPITTYARPDVMQQIARETGGRFFENPFAEHALDALLAQRPSGAQHATHVRVPIDRYQWPLGIAFFALFLGSLANRGAE
ncbi:MAG TPA: VWA domain-containing protein [Thermoanaerobaculia bacterium]|nr:VWA domain-containing protein [Thermoanaerobaculia bacterium]